MTGQVFAAIHLYESVQSTKGKQSAIGNTGQVEE